MATDLGVESLLGDADSDELGNEDARKRLSLSTRYLANWYKATSGSDNKAIWYQKIDVVRNSIETLYANLLADNNPFLSQIQKADYNAASGQWADLWRQLMTTTDTIDTSLLDKAADYFSTAIKLPTVAIPNFFQGVGGIINDSVGKFMAQVWPVLTIAVVVGGVYLFRKPLAKLVS